MTVKGKSMVTTAEKKGKKTAIIYTVYSYDTVHVYKHTSMLERVCVYVIVLKCIWM